MYYKLYGNEYENIYIDDNINLNTIDNKNNIEVINYSFTDLIEIPDLSSFSNLKKLYASYSNISKIPKLPISIKQIFISDSKFRKINNLDKYINLECLDLSNNNINILLDLSYIINLKYLSCYCCNIRKLIIPSNLEYLMCVNNNIKNSNFHSITQCKKLDIYKKYNKYTKIYKLNIFLNLYIETYYYISIMKQYASHYKQNKINKINLEEIK